MCAAAWQHRELHCTVRPPYLPYWSGLQGVSEADRIRWPLDEPRRWSSWGHRVASVCLGCMGVAVVPYRLCGQDAACRWEMTDVARSCLSVALLAFTGGVARLLYSYKADMGWPAAARIVATSFYVGVVIGLIVWEPLQDRPTVLLALIGATSWLGVDLARSVFELIVRRLLGGQGDLNGNGTKR